LTQVKTERERVQRMAMHLEDDVVGLLDEKAGMHILSLRINNIDDGVRDKI
jgi:hypothetical protein